VFRLIGPLGSLEAKIWRPKSCLTHRVGQLHGLQCAMRGSPAELTNLTFLGTLLFLKDVQKALCSEGQMGNYNIFVSVGATSNEEQEGFVRAIEDRLRSEGLIPHTVGRNTFSAEAPLKKVTELLDSCEGAVVIALERSFFPSGIEKRGGPNERQLSNVRLPTTWNHIEAAMAYSRGLPLLIIVESGLKSEGLLERGYDWYVQYVKPVTSALNTLEFNGVLADWKSMVESIKVDPNKAGNTALSKSTADLTIRELVGGLRPAQLWGFLVGLAAIVTGAFALGLKLAGHV
jgi:hypothetical protein